jgi:hypothetical protein
MAGFDIAVTVAILLGVVVIGLVMVVAWAVRREDRRYTMALEPPDPVSGMARRMNGLRRRDLDAEFFGPAR